MWSDAQLRAGCCTPWVMLGSDLTADRQQHSLLWDDTFVRLLWGHS